MVLEAANDGLRQQLEGKGVSVTKEKLQEASKMLEEQLLTEADFAAIKQKFMSDNFGLSGGTSGAQPDFT